MNTAQYWIKKLNLQKLEPEGGYFRRTYVAPDSVAGELLQGSFEGQRALSTCIYYLMKSDNFSQLHQLKGDEIWCFHYGSPLTIHMIDPGGSYEVVKLGVNPENGEVPQFVVPAGKIFGATVNDPDSFSLGSCMVSPGFIFDDFKLFSRKSLLQQFPQHRKLILELTLP